MKTYSLWILCLFVLWKTCRNHGSSQCKKIGLFRSSVFSSISRKKHSLIKTLTTHFISCAARCLEDDKCVAIKENNQGKCITLEKKSDVGYVWIRNSVSSSAETCKSVSRTQYFLSAHVSSRKRGKKGNKLKEKLKWFDPNRDETEPWKFRLAVSTDASQTVITSLLGSSQVIILLLDKPRSLCSGKISGKFTCYQVPSNWDTIGGMQLHRGHLYVPAGKSLFRMEIYRFPLRRKLSPPQFVMNLPDTPSEVAIDALDGKRMMIFYSSEGEDRIDRILKYSHKESVKHMDSLNISCNHFTFTIDPIGHVIYILTDDWNLSQIRDIHTENPPKRSTVRKIPRHFNLPITKLLFSVNTIYLIWPGKNLVVSVDVQKNRYGQRLISNDRISRPPRVITVIAR